jgi:GNAT superfamily N-acetyltransferase
MNIAFRPAAINDLPAIVRLLADDFLGTNRERVEDPLPESYLKAFEEIDAGDTNELIVVELANETGGAIVGTMQLTFIPGISTLGAKRLLIEAVRVDGKYRGRGIGKKMMEWAIERAKEKGCKTVQLTTHNERKDAHRFYESLGFKGSHLGMKLSLK